MFTDKCKNRIFRNSHNINTKKKSRSLYNDKKNAGKRKNSLHNKRLTKLSSKENFITPKLSHTHINNVYFETTNKKNQYHIKTENNEGNDFINEQNVSNKKNISKDKFLPKILISKFKKPFQISTNTTNNNNQSVEKYNFNSRYQIIKLLGKGSNSSVYLARKKSSSNLYAVKKVSKLKLLKDNELKNFKVIHLNIHLI